MSSSNVTLYPMFADIWSDLSRNELALGVLLLMALITAYILIITSIGKTREFFGRKPPVDDDLRALRSRLDGLAPSEKIDELVKQLAYAANKNDVDTIRDSLKGYVDQAQMDRRMGEVKEQLTRVEKDLSEQIAELQGHFKEQMGEFRERAYTIWADAQNQREGLHSRINIIAECVSEIRGWMRAVKVANPS